MKRRILLAAVLALATAGCATLLPILEKAARWAGYASSAVFLDYDRSSETVVRQLQKRLSICLNPIE